MSETSALPLLAIIVVVAALGFFIYLSTRRTGGVPDVSPRKQGKIVESAWHTEEEFAEFLRQHDLVPPKRPETYAVWVRSGSFAVAAVSMKSGDKISVVKVSLY